jgi:hypothetical protein
VGQIAGIHPESARATLPHPTDHFLCGLAIGKAFLVVPGVGPVLVAGSLSAALAGAAEGAVVGAVIGGLGGALVGWGIPSIHVQRYESHLSEGRFVVLARTDSEGVESTRSVLVLGALDPPEVYEIGVVNARAPRGSLLGGAPADSTRWRPGRPTNRRGKLTGRA